MVFTSLGLDNNQIDAMLAESPLWQYRNLFVPLAFYSDIEEVGIQGKYVDVTGQEYQTLKG